MESSAVFRYTRINRKKRYGFKSRNCLPIVEEVANLEHDLMMIKNIQFTNIKNDFQTKLRNAISDIQKCEKVLIPADESRNIYQMETGDYKKLLDDNIRRTCQKSDERKINNINKDAKKIALVLDLEDRIEKMQESESYITVKDQKEHFLHKISCHLIKISKSTLVKLANMSLIMLIKNFYQSQKSTSAKILTQL